MSEAGERPPDPIRIRVFGHPLHASLVHVPIGVLASVGLWDALALLWPDAGWQAMAFWSLALGTAATLPAVATGLLDYTRLPEDSPEAKGALRHMYMALGSVACYGTSLFLRGGPRVGSPGEELTAIALAYLGLGLLALTGWLGGELVFRHGVGRTDPTVRLRDPGG